MKNFLTVLLFQISICIGWSQASYTEFYCDTAGDNRNSGSSSNTAATVSYTGGDWVASTGVFTPAGGANPSSAGITNGAFVSVFVDGDLTNNFVALVTNVSSTTVTVSLTAKSGTAPSDGTGNRSLRFGGAWKGPNDAVAYPWGWIQGSLTNTNGFHTRVNFRSGTYTMTNGVVHTNGGSTAGAVIIFQAYTNSPGDGGRATIDGYTNGTYFNLINLSSVANNQSFINFDFMRNGSTGTAANGIEVNGAENCFINCSFRLFSRRGVHLAGNSGLISCYATTNNTSNVNNHGGIGLNASGAYAINCISEFNVGSNVDGFSIDGGVTIRNCISRRNGRHGASSTGDVNINVSNSDFYGNVGSGINFGAGSASPILMNVHSCNFITNGLFGINFNGQENNGTIYNCGFGTGTQTNASGNFSTMNKGADIRGTILYTANTTPWVDPVNGDFRISSSQAKFAGYGTYLSNAVTVGFPDIGAAQATNSSGGGSFVFVQ